MYRFPKDLDVLLLTIFSTFFIFLNIYSVKASDVCFNYDGNRYCYPYDCSFIKSFDTDKNSNFQKHIRKTNQDDLFSKAKRKCSFREAGESLRDTTDNLLDGVNKTIDNIGVGEFFKGWSKN